MECPSCGLDVLVQDGAITPHLRPDTLEVCGGKAKPAAHEAKAEPKEDTPAPTKAPPKTKAQH